MAAGSASTSPPVITATPARNLLVNLLRHRLADLGTCQVVPHWAQVLVYSGGCHGNRMQRSSPPEDAQVKRLPRPSAHFAIDLPGEGIDRTS
jgi:hypothetical protein